LALEVSFEADQPVKEAHWEVCCLCHEVSQAELPQAECYVSKLFSVQVQYMVDMTAQRHVLQLGSTEVQDYPAGRSTMHFSASAIDISGLKRSWLNNVGLLLV
jgi:hypothetical protein